MIKGGLGNLMKQAQQMQENMQKMQDKLAEIEVQGQAASGMVKITMTCKYQVRRVELKDGLLEEGKDMVEDLMVLAFNDAVKQAEALIQEKMSGMTAGLPLPPGFKMPF